MILDYEAHFYGKSTGNYSVELPDDMVFIFVDGDVGSMLYKGYNHYLGATHSSIDNLDKLGVTYGISKYKFADINFIELSNVIIKSDIKIVDGEELYNMFHLADYYIFKYSENLYKLNMDENNTLSKELVQEEKLLSVSKILKISSPNMIDIMHVHQASLLDYDEFLNIVIHKNVSMRQLFDDYKCKIVIEKYAHDKFIDAINKVLNKVNLKLNKDEDIYKSANAEA